MEEHFFENRILWRQWLEKNHKKCKGIWVIYFKKHIKKVSIVYEEALEEALCFGWIDSKVNRIDDERYRQVFTPRKSKSMWSLANVRRAEKLIDEGIMMPAGFAEIKKAKKNGHWQNAYSTSKKKEIPSDFLSELKKNKTAETNFFAFTNAQKMQYVRYISEAKQEITRRKRILQVVLNASQNIKPSMN